MRRVIIMRHGKAERGEGKPDYDRTLEDRGWIEAAAVGAELADLGIMPDTILCSAARRTRDTLSAILPHFPHDCTIHLLRTLYDAEVPELRETLRTADGECILLIGHNPSVHLLAAQFAGGNPDAGALRAGFPTSTAAVFSVGSALDSVKLERIVEQP